MRRRALDTGLADVDVEPTSLGSQFLDPTNPYGAQYRGGMNPAQRSARRALSGY